MISFEPTEDEQAIRDEVRKFAAGELRKHGRDCEKAQRVAPELRKTYHELGLTTLDWPEALGGAGLSTVARAIVEEELAWGDGGLAVALDGPGAAGIALRELGSAAQRERWLKPFADPAAAGRIAALALSEADLGADMGHVVARAERSDGAYALHGRKLFVYGADEADLFVVFARAPSDDPRFAPPRAYVLEKGAAGLTIGRPDDRIGLQAARSFEVLLDNARAARDAALEPEGSFEAAFDRFLARVWIVNAARQVGIARAATEYAAMYAQDRSAFGKKIGQFQGIAFKIADMAMATDAARWLVWRAAADLDKGRPEALRRAALAAAQANETAVKAAIDCVQVLGGAGYMEDYPAEKWMREARALAQIAGCDPVRNHLAAEREYGPIDAGPAPDPAQAFAAFGQAFSS
jgi:alkylation response protein AidB-like acyl-CoA dehydrogenase